tara:strand:+ start:476 stop:826 length:351 start_codon:yes stop_codon:yes gene_type:complete
MESRHSEDLEHHFHVVSKAYYQSGRVSKGYTVGKDDRKKYKLENEEYRQARVEVLKKLYEENPVEEHLITIYKHPTDGRKNISVWDSVDENPYSPFDDLDKLNELMPNPEDYYGKD